MASRVACVALAVAWLLLLFPAGTAADAAEAAQPQVGATGAIAGSRVSAIGRIEPRDGLITVAGPSDPVVVVSRLEVERGQRVSAGQVLAVLDCVDPRRSRVNRAREELAQARADLARQTELERGLVVAEVAREQAQFRERLSKLELEEAEARLERCFVRSPIDGQVIDVHTRAGERVGAEGIVELGRTDEMFAIAEVYETDVRRVQVGQRARVSSPALPAPVYGTVERVAGKIGKADALGTDPAARTDARVVEVEIRLEQAASVAALTNLQVEIELGVD